MKFLALVLVTLLIAPSPVNSWGLFDGIANAVKNTASGVASGIAGVGNFAGNVVAGTAGGVASVANAAGNVVGNTVTGLGNAIGSLFGGGESSASIEVNLDPGALIRPVVDAGHFVGQVGKDLIEGTGNVILGGLEAVGNFGISLGKAFEGKFNFDDALGKARNYWFELGGRLKGKIGGAANSIGDIIQHAGEMVKPTFDRSGNIVGYISVNVEGNVKVDLSAPVFYKFGDLVISLGAAVNGVRNKVVGVWDKFGNKLEDVAESFSTSLARAVEAAGALAGSAVQGVGSAVGGAVATAGQLIDSAINNLRLTWDDEFDGKFDFGDALGKSWRFWNDLKGKLSGKGKRVANAIGDIVSSVGEAVRPTFDKFGNIAGYVSVKVDGNWDISKPVYYRFGNLIISLGSSVGGGRNQILGVWDRFGFEIEGGVDDLTYALTKAFNAAENVVGNLGLAVGEAVGAAGNAALNIGGALGNLAGNVIGGAVEGVAGLLNDGAKAAAYIGDTLRSEFGFRFDPSNTFLKFDLGDAIGRSWNLWGDLKGKLKGKVSGGASALGELIGKVGVAVKPKFDASGNINGFVSINLGAGFDDFTKPAYFKFGNFIVNLGGSTTGVRNKIIGLWDAKGIKLEGAIDKFVNFLSGAFEAAGELAADTANNFGAIVQGLGNALGGAVNVAGNLVGGALDAAGNIAGNVVLNVGGALGNLAGNVIGGALEGVAGLLNDGAKAAAYIGDTLRSEFGFRFDPSNTFLKFDLGDAISRSWNSWGDLKGKLKGKVGGRASALGELIGKVGVAVKPKFDASGNINGFVSINLGAGFDDFTKPAYFKFGNFIVNLGGSTTGVRNKIIGLWDAKGIKLEGAIDKFVNFLSGAFEAAGELAADTANNFGAIVQGLGNALGGAVNVAGNLVGGALDAAGNIAGNVVSNVGGALGNVAGGIAGSLGNAAEASWSFWNNVGNGLKFATGGVANAVGNVANAAGGALGTAAGAVGNVVGGAANIAANFADRLRNKFAFKFDPKNNFGQFDLSDALGRSWNFWSNFNANIKGKVGGVANAIGEIIGSVGEAVKPRFDASGNIAGFVSINLGAGFDDFTKPAYFKFGNFIVNLGVSSTGVRNKIIGLWDAKGIKLEGAIDKFVNFLSGAFEGAAELAGEAASNLGVAVGNLGNAVGGALNTAAQLIGSLFNNFQLKLDYPFKGKFDFGTALKTSWNFWGNLKSKLKGKADVSAVCEIISQAGVLVKPTFDAFGNINGYVSIDAGVKIDFSKPIYYKFGNLVVSLGSTSGGVLNKVLGLWDAKGIKIQASVNDFVASLIGALDATWEFAKGVSVKVGVSLGDLAAGLSGTLRIDGEAGWSLLNKLRAGVEGAVGIAGEVVGGVGNAVGQVVGATGNAVGQVVGATGNAVGNIVAGAGNVGAGLFGGLWNTVGGLAHGAVGAAGAAVDTLFPEGG